MRSTRSTPPLRDTCAGSPDLGGKGARGQMIQRPTCRTHERFDMAGIVAGRKPGKGLSVHACNSSCYAVAWAWGRSFHEPQHGHCHCCHVETTSEEGAGPNDPPQKLQAGTRRTEIPRRPMASDWAARKAAVSSSKQFNTSSIRGSTRKPLRSMQTSYFHAMPKSPLGFIGQPRSRPSRIWC